MDSNPFHLSHTSARKVAVGVSMKRVSVDYTYLNINFFTILFPLLEVNSIR